MNRDKIILDLCGGTGAWSKPYADAGYDVKNITLPDFDVRLFPCGNTPFTFKGWGLDPFKNSVYGILAAPPCTHFAGSGARWWRKKGEKAILEGLSIVDACMRIIHIFKPQFWCLENPIGRLYVWLGKPKMYFNPCDYGDPWTKKTCLWGKFNIPKKNPVEPEKKNRIHHMSPGPDRSKLRSITPPGFARAFFESNR